MAIDLMKSGISVGVGLVDTVLERMDATAKSPTGAAAPRTGTFKKWSDLSRLALAVAGYGIQAMYPRQARIGEALALSATPLLVKTLVADTVADMFKENAASGFVPTRTYAPAPAAPAGYGRSYDPEFNLTRTL